MLHPKYELKIGSLTFEPKSSDFLTGLTVDCSLNIPSDTFYGSIINNKLAKEIKKGDLLKISLGYEDKLTVVFQGNVYDLIFSAFDTSVNAYSCTFNLSHLKIDKFYEQRTAGQIVKDLAVNASAETLDIEDGVKFPYYAIDSNKSAYEHIRELAVICGFDVYCNQENKLMFKKYNPNKKHAVEYGKNLIAVTMGVNPSPYQGVKIIAESPSSESGTQTAHWLKKEQVYSLAGEEESLLTIVNRAVKDEDTARKIAEERLDTLKYQKIVHADVVGNPEIYLGDAITLEALPNPLLNGEYKIITIQHLYSKRKGFITKLICRGLSKE
jgi:phage protein D